MTSPINNNDAAALLGEHAKQTVYIYRVYFDMLVHIENELGLDDEDGPILLSDSLDVDGGRDVREVQARVEEFVMNSGKYKVPAKEFFITGSKRLAMSEI